MTEPCEHSWTYLGDCENCGADALEELAARDARIAQLERENTALGRELESLRELYTAQQHVVTGYDWPEIVETITAERDSWREKSDGQRATLMWYRNQFQIECDTRDSLAALVVEMRGALETCYSLSDRPAITAICERALALDTSAAGAVLERVRQEAVRPYENLLLCAYSVWSEDFYSAGFMSPSPDTIARFLYWLRTEGERGAERTDYEEQMLNILSSALLGSTSAPGANDA